MAGVRDGESISDRGLRYAATGKGSAMNMTRHGVVVCNSPAIERAGIAVKAPRSAASNKKRVPKIWSVWSLCKCMIYSLLVKALLVKRDDVECTLVNMRHDLRRTA